MRNVMVIGGAGFVGSALVARLHETPCVQKVLIYDNLSSTGSWGRVIDHPDNFIVEGNARDLDYLRTTMRDFAPDTVFHLAANPDIARAVREPTIDFEQGTILTQNVVEAMRVNGVRRLIYFSGSGVYGENPDEVFHEDYGPMEPISTYGASKLAGEALICAYANMFGLTARAFRFANVVGPRQTHGVGFDFLRKLKADPKKLVILGDGTQTKSYVAVSDVLNAVLLVCDRCISDAVEAPSPYNVYNVGTADTVTVNQIADMACLAMGLKIEEVAREFTGGDRGWKGDVPKVRFNCARMHSLGWRPEYTAKDAVFLSLMAMAEELR